MSYLPLSIWDLVLASLLILINGGLSLYYQLGIERHLFIAVLRMVVQLTAVGFVLKFIFLQTSPLWTLALAFFMVAVAGREVLARQTYKIKGWQPYALSASTLLIVGAITTLFAVVTIINSDHWYTPQYFLPILGMILGNSLTGISIGLESLVTQAKRDHLAIETRLALGHSRFEALSHIRAQALKTGMMPIINSMAASGLVSLPGMMTGQILSGVDPVEATKYQILIMFLIAGATGLVTLFTVIGAIYMITDDRHRLTLFVLRK